MYEELLADADTTLPTVIPQLRIAKLGVSVHDAGNLLAWAQSRCAAEDTEVRERLSGLVDAYQAPGRVWHEPVPD